METFEFEISDGENTWTATIDERGNIEYPEILYTLRDVGKHTYTVKEKTANIPGLINDPTVYTVTVEVIDDGDDTLEIKASENYKLLNFVNEESKITIRKEDFTSKTTLEGAKYTISGDNLKGVRVGGKEITETDLKDGSYTFEGASVEIVGLYDGTYTLKEVTSPEGYTTISEFTFEIENGVIVKVTAGTDGDATYSEDGKILTVYNKKIPEPVKDKDEEEAEEEPEEKIQEKQETISPQTGDHVLIYVIGLVLAVIGMFNLKRK